MFDKEYSFHASHAEKVKALTAQFGISARIKLFTTNRDVYIIAPIIGFLYNRQASIDKSTDITTKIFSNELMREEKVMWYNYRLIMLLDTKREPDLNKRMDKAFRYYGKPEAADDESWYNQCTLGGVDVLYEKLIEGAKNSDDYPAKLVDFMEEFEERYNSNIPASEIVDLCIKARS